MPSKTIKIDSTGKRAAVIAAGVAALVLAFCVVRWTLANSASTRADTAAIARLTTETAPDDPQTHFAAAVLLEKQFEMASLDAAVKEYEKAAALSPSNYLYWLALGSARERNGDQAGGEAAIRKALELAPNYSRVHWALGNTLVRQGRVSEGFGEIRRAVAGDPKLANLAASTAWQLLAGDINAVRGALGDSEQLTISLALLLANEKRFDESLAIWESIAAESQSRLAESGNSLEQRFLGAKRFRDGLKVRARFDPGSARIGLITNGGFEEAVKGQNASVFDWQIAAGQQPQISPTSGQKHDGNVSLVLVFNSADSKDFRTVSQTVAVEPGREYHLGAFYRSELRTKAGFVWEVVDASNNAVIANTEAAVPSSDWTEIGVRFRVPATTDGIIIRLGRVNCTGPVCAVAGNLWLDDINLKQLD